MIIVYQRLERDFGANRIFYQIPLIPPEWRGAFSQKVILRGEASEPDPAERSVRVRARAHLTDADGSYVSPYSPYSPALDVALARPSVTLTRRV